MQFLDKFINRIGFGADDQVNNMQTVEGLQRYINTPTKEEKRAAFFGSLSGLGDNNDFGAAMNRVSAMHQSQRDARLGKLQQNAALKALLAPDIGKRREAWGRDKQGNPIKFHELVYDDGRIERVAGSEIPMYKPEDQGMADYRNESLAMRREAAAAAQQQAEANASIRQMQAEAAKSRQEVAARPKPMPPALVKLQDSRLQEMSDLYARAAPLSQSLADLKSGKLKLNAASNVLTPVLGAFNLGGDEADALAAFKANLEGLAIDQSNLAKGVQTDRDFDRARRSILENINNERYVKAHLPELIELNNKRNRDRKLMINQMRQSQGLPPMTEEEFSAYATDLPTEVISTDDDLINKYLTD